MLKYTYLKGQMQTDYHLEPSLEKSPFLWMSVLAVWQSKQQEKKLISPAMLHLINYLNNIAQHYFNIGPAFRVLNRFLSRR